VKVQINMEKCTGCRICEAICTFTKYKEFNPKRSRIRVTKVERLFLDMPSICQQCINPLCVANCVDHALKKQEDGTILVNEELCTGCEACTECCPFKAIFLDPVTLKSIVCDTCNGSPQCVKWCPTGALEFNTAKPAPQTSQSKNAVVSSKRLLDKWGVPKDEYKQYVVDMKKKVKVKNVQK
jgi:carbon-monoxide dehydrogenase iron sulfur subunit